MTSLNIDFFTYLELEKIGIGAFSPLEGFMDEEDFYSVAKDMRLKNGIIFPLPVVLPLPEEKENEIKKAVIVDLIYDNEKVAQIFPTSIYRPDFNKVLPLLFGTNNDHHPGFKMLVSLGKIFLGGKIKFLKKVKHDLSKYDLSPKKVKGIIKKKELSTIAGFQTRNVPHKAHEYLQRLALEKVDGIFIQPLIGRKIKGDFTPDAIITSYKYLIKNYLPESKVILGALTTSMRYAGPREAVFHAIIRKNYGCTHFIVGRDHAGVSGYYSDYQAQELCKEVQEELDIKIMHMRGPFYCNKCDGVVTDNVCNHINEDSDVTFQISGSKIRSMLLGQEKISKKYIREEIVNSLKGKKLFIDEDEL
jgi:sulfate adenylyltransferase